MGSVRQAVLCTATPPDLQTSPRYHHGCPRSGCGKDWSYQRPRIHGQRWPGSCRQEYYDLSCATFSERFDIEHQVKKNDMEIHTLEMEVNDMHGKFIIPKLKKVHTFQLTSGEE